MTNKVEQFKVPLLSPDATPIRSSGLWQTRKQYRGQLVEGDALVTAIRAAIARTQLSAEQELLLRSFAIAWLRGRPRNLGNVASFSIQLPRSVEFLSQVGFLDRTASKIATTAAGVAVCAIYLDLAWELLAYDPSTATTLETTKLLGHQLSAEAGVMMLPSSIFREIDKSFGKPGTAIARSQFSSDPIVSMLRLCQLRSAVDLWGLSKESKQAIELSMDHRVFALLLANSRQIAGLCRRGKSEASAAIAAHAAIALGICNLPNRDELLACWHHGAEQLQGVQQQELLQMTDSLRENLRNNFSSIDRQLNRQLTSATTTEAIGLVASPVGMSFHALEIAAASVEKFSPQGSFKSAMKVLSDGFATAKQAADSTPDALATAIDGGISLEAWARSKIQKFWPGGDAKNAKKT